jgi:predicted RND superfamily exporter protein
MVDLYKRLVVDRAIPLLVLLGLLGLAALSQVDKTRLDASSDALLLQGDPDLAYFRETSKNYSSSEFLILTWQPPGALLSPDSLEPLKGMTEELRRIPGIQGVTSLLDVPLLESPPLSLSDLAKADALPTLSDPEVDRSLAFDELTTSPVYRNLLVGESGDVTAVQVTLESNPLLQTLLDERELLRLQEQRGDIGDARTRLVEVETAYDELVAAESDERAAVVAAVRAVADRYRPYAKIFVGGVPMIAADMIAFVKADLVTFGAAILGIMMLVLAVIFKDWRWVVAPLINCSLTATLMLGFLAWTDWRMTVISSNFVAVLLIVVLSLSLHLIVRYRELERVSPAQQRGERAAEAARLMAIPCLYTALTTLVAFASLLVAGIQPVIDFGLMMSLGIIVGFLCTFLVVPSLMSVMPEPTGKRTLATERSLTLVFSGWVERYGNGVLGITAVLAIATAVGISRLEVENRFIDYFKDSTEIYQGMELLDSKLGGTIPLDIILYAPDQGLSAGDATPADASSTAMDNGKSDVFPSEDLGEDPFSDEFLEDDPFGDADIFASDGSSRPAFWFTPVGRQLLDRAHQLVEAREETGKVLSLSTAFEVMDGLYGAPLGAIELALVQNSMPEDVNDTLVSPYFNADADQARISVRAMETSKALRRDQFLRELRQTLISELAIEPERVQFTSLLVLYNNVLQSLFKSQILTLAVVFIAIGAMFWVLFRSLSLALLALAPNLLAAGLVLGIMGLAGIPLDIMTITIAAIVVGIGVDDCIHYIYRFREEFDVDKNYRAAMHRSHGSIGRAMYYTTLTVMVGFSLLTLSNFNPSLYFGVLTDIAMMAAVAGALLLLPKLLLVFKPLGPEGVGR